MKKSEHSVWLLKLSISSSMLSLLIIEQLLFSVKFIISVEVVVI